MANFLGDLSGKYTSARDASFSNELSAQRYMLDRDRYAYTKDIELAKEAREKEEARVVTRDLSKKYWGKRAHQAFLAVERAIQSLGYTSEQKDQYFNFYPTGVMNWSTQDLDRVARGLWEKSERDNTPGGVHTTQTIDEYVHKYTRQYLNDSGAAAAILGGENKGLGSYEVEVDPETGARTYTPTVITYDAKSLPPGAGPNSAMRVNADPLTREATPYGDGGTPNAIDENDLNYLLRNYTLTSLENAGYAPFQVEAQRRLDAGPPRINPETGAPVGEEALTDIFTREGSDPWDPQRNIQNRKRVEADLAERRSRSAPSGDPNVGARSIKDPDIATSAFDPKGSGYDYDAAAAAGLEQGADGHWPSRAPDGRILKGEGHETFAETEKAEIARGNEIYRGADGNLYSHKQGERPAAAAVTVIPAFTRSGGDELPELTLRESNQEGVLDTRKTDDRTGMPLPLSRTSLLNLIKGEGGSTDLPRFIKLLDKDGTYIHDNEVIPVGLSAEQFNVYSPAVQRRLIAAAKARSDENIGKGLREGVEGQGLTLHVTPSREARASGRMAHGDPSGYPHARTVEDWEEEYGEFLPIEGMSKEQTLQAVDEFYGGKDIGRHSTYPNKRRPSNIARIEKTLRTHPEYYKQFKELGAVEFAKKYMEDENFLKGLVPENLVSARDKVEINKIARDIEERAGVKFEPDGQVSVRNPDGAWTRTTFRKVLKFPVYTGKPHEDFVATAFTNVLDTEVERFNFGEVSRNQRKLLSYVAIAALQASGLSAPEMEANRENLLYLAEYGVSKVRADSYMKPEKVAEHMLKVSQEERLQAGLAQEIANSVITSEQNAENAANYRRNIDAGIQNSIRTAENARLNREATVLDRAKADTTEQWKAGLKLFTDTRTNLIKVFEGSTYAHSWFREVTGWEKFGIKGLDAATYAVGLGRTDLLKLMKTPVFKNSINALQQSLESAPTPYLRSVLQPMVANHLNVLMKGEAAKDWWANNRVVGRGSPLTEAGEISPQIVFVVKGKVVYDMNQVWGPTNPNGALPDEIRLVTGDNVQRGSKITPTNVKNMVGQSWYSMLMHYAIGNANRIHKGG